MLIGVRNDCTAGANLMEKMQALKELHYDFLELALKPEEVEALDRETVEEYRAVSDETGLPIYTTSMGHFPFFAQKSEDERKSIVGQIRKMIDLTEALGGRVILLASKEESEDTKDYLSIYRHELKNAADYAAEKGIALALEPVGRFKSSALDRLVREIGHEAIGMYYDMGNCIYGGEDPVDQIRKSVDIAKAIHIKGAMDISLDQMPLNQILQVLRSAHYSGPGCIEIGSKDGTNQHLADAIKLLRTLDY
jgi:sugar phosphate isomerase/epimerase